MQIVIKMSKKDYELYKADDWNIPKCLRDVLANGAPLPKGHGDLIDRKALIESGIHKGFCDWYDEIKYAPTIIEAESEK